MECITALCLSLLWQSARKRLHFSLIALAKSDAPRESSSAQKMKVFVHLNFITSNRVSAIISSTLTRQDPHLIWKKQWRQCKQFLWQCYLHLTFSVSLLTEQGSLKHAAESLHLEPPLSKANRQKWQKSLVFSSIPNNLVKTKPSRLLAGNQPQWRFLLISAFHGPLS